MLKLHKWAYVKFSTQAMIMVELIEVGLATISKAAMIKGMSNFVFVVYYNALGTAILLPCFVGHRLRSNRLPITFPLLSRLFLLGLIGLCLSQMCAFAGISYTSPTLAAAMGNLIPVFTFSLAVILRMEKLDLRNISSQAKSLGTIIAISGALIATLYKGPPLLMAQTSSDSPHLLFSQQSKWLIGCLLLTVTFLLLSIWNILQAATTKEYPDEVTIVFFYSLFGTIQSSFLSFILERTTSAWKLHNRIEIIAIVYGAVSVTVLRAGIITWCLRERGPVFVAMFKPFGIAIAIFMGFVFLRDTLYLGSVIGAAAIVAGFYGVIWGQAKDKENAITKLESPSCEKTPLLQSKQRI
ncbi:hypothetical protein Nepgr_015207 [Nepenthes gracilis]|uniref:WAT1-related protein n=1 Tax=Nepenthes gracilis TaxID=150966 RepID=A0AAD3XR35_NEPGR|nr:hypothetical protein Nepgr_015207 [Nepenthes gracilis]